MLEHLGIARFFRVVIGGDSVATKKPDPLPLLVALQRLGLERGAAVMVGDSETDLESARRAAVRFVAVSYGFRDRATLEGLGAEHVVDCFADLIDDLDCGGAEKL